MTWSQWWYRNYRTRTGFNKFVFWSILIGGPASLLGIAAFLIAQYSSGPQLDRIEAVSNQSEAKLDTANERLQTLQLLTDTYYRSHHEQLSRKYPLGYAIFYKYQEFPVTFNPTYSSPFEGVEAAWSQATIRVDRSRNNLSISIPYLKLKDNDNVFTHLTAGTRRASGQRALIFDEGDGLCKLWIEVIDAGEDYTVAVLGVNRVRF